MRRSDREVKDFKEIADILQRADAIRLAMHHTPYPYIIPLSFGVEICESRGSITLYFHGAAEGKKSDLIADNPNVCVEADIFHRYVKTPHSFTAEYESFIGFGKAERVLGDDAVKGIELIIAHCKFTDSEYDRRVLNMTAVYKITLDSFSGKRRFT